MKKLILIIAALGITGYAQAKPAFTGQDLTGIYDCIGEDAHEGTVTLTLKPEQSTGNYAAYNFKTGSTRFRCVSWRSSSGR